MGCGVLSPRPGTWRRRVSGAGVAIQFVRHDACGTRLGRCLAEQQHHGPPPRPRVKGWHPNSWTRNRTESAPRDMNWLPEPFEEGPLAGTRRHLGCGSSGWKRSSSGRTGGCAPAVDRSWADAESCAPGRRTVQFRAGPGACPWRSRPVRICQGRAVRQHWTRFITTRSPSWAPVLPSTSTRCRPHLGSCGCSPNRMGGCRASTPEHRLRAGEGSAEVRAPAPVQARSGSR